MIDYGAQCGETAIVIEAAFLANKETLERCCSVTTIGRSIGLKVINADLGAGMHGPARFAEEWRHMAGGAFGWPFKNRLTLRRERVVVVVVGSFRRWDRHLI